ncbi:MAG: hypothetical protein OXI66_13215, partial [Boseongicola sp.]|nr:hypothetical protein [Boseongicola sp.]
FSLAGFAINDQIDVLCYVASDLAKLPDMVDGAMEERMSAARALGSGRDWPTNLAVIGRAIAPPP